VIEPAGMHAEFCDIEEMVRAAGGYLEVSDDLRPRTLEEARDESRETSTRSWIMVLAVVVVFLAMSAGGFRGRLASTSSLNLGVSANGDQLYADALQKAAQTNVDPSWTLVDAFSELRQRQSSLIEDAF
jgi:hypothetical protein